MAETAYQDSAVFMPGRGAVLIAPVGTKPPTMEEIKTWLSKDTTAAIGSYVPVGYTSLDELPQIGGDTEGGEVVGVWENPSFRTTAVKTVDTVTITPVQFSEVPLKHRFGANGSIGEDGYFHIPPAYTATEIAVLVIVIDGTNFLAFQYPKAASAPGDGIEMDPEKFLGIPVVYTVLNQAGEPRGRIGHSALKKAVAPGVGG
ncbi:hypothetical protein GP475_08765 [Corynebacterium poyangense]|uniref:Uncharacterized protein n=1 Tax=Corynebacterium poyangense TaxID=2684405 RepID=A0A7H0SQ93_9CORY|nr:hypothetical protein [Corynebacterium poyangense]QNQ90718.1 hypothetical protein GP475_08765 [Corynebacterium poyangense]